LTTADFAYLRFHGSAGLHSSCYADDELDRWVERLSNLAVNLGEVYVYFNNDTEAFAVKNALTLCRYLTWEGA